MTKVLGTEVPTSIVQIKGNTFRYMAQPSRTDSYGVTSAPDWPSPTSLSFPTESMHIVKLGAVADIGPCPMPPEELLGRTETAIRASVRRIARMLRDNDQVVEVEGMFSEIVTGPFHDIGLRTVARAWPAVPGVTVRYEDSTR
jgi:hypothetical protein